MHTYGKFNTKFHSEVHKILSQYESSIDHMHATLQNRL